MSFRIEKPQADFTIVCNAILRDARISLRSKGLYALMVSKPEGWIFHEAAMLNEFTEGRDALRAAFKELIEAKWLSKLQPRDGGKFNHNVYRIHSTVDWKTVDGETADGKTPPSNTDRSKTNEPTACAFEKFWEAYPSKVGKKVCEHKWRSLSLDANLDFILAGLERWKASDRWKRGYVVDPLTFLNQERWKDVPPNAPSAPSKPEEVRVRETSEAEKAEGADRLRFLELSKQHRGKTADEIIEMMNQNGSAM